MLPLRRAPSLLGEAGSDVLVAAAFVLREVER
jgi:hypothetical protein